MNIGIVYDSKYGNNKVIAEALASYFKDGNNIQLYYAKKLSQKALIEGGIDMLVLGGPIHLGAPSITMKRWANRMANMLNQKGIQLKKIAIWGTHLKDKPNTPVKYSWDGVKQKWKKILDKFPAEKKVNEIQGFDITPIAGRDTIESGWQDIVAQFANVVKNL